MKKIICLVSLFGLISLIEAQAQFTGGATSPTVGLVTLSNPNNNLLLGPTQLGGMTKLYLNGSATTTLSIDASTYNGGAQPRLNFNVGGSTSASIFYDVAPAQNTNYLRIIRGSLGIHMNTSEMVFGPSSYSICNGPGCPVGTYKFLGSTYIQSLNIGNGSLAAPMLDVTGISRFDKIGVGIANPSGLLHVVAKTSDPSNPTAVFDLNTNGSATTYPRISIYQNASLNPRSCMDASVFDQSLGVNAVAPFYLQSLYGGNVGIGYFGVPTNTTVWDAVPASKLQIQQGALQITNSGDVTTQITGKTGLIMGHFGDKSSTSTTSYSWIQSSAGPLLLNPASGNSLSGAQTNNYVAIGFTPTGSELTPITSAMMGYNLMVKGKIMCEELKIKLKPSSGTAWPDYVFASDYKLMSVDSLQNYIAQNNHLPDVPSAAEVEENGIMAGEMNAVLLRKIEELTLYMIEQNKNTSAQAEQIELLKKQNELLMLQIQLLQTTAK